MADRARGRRSGDGIDRTVLETGVGSTGTLLEANLPKTGRCPASLGSTASRPGAVESWSAGTEAGFPRCGTTGQAACGSRARLEFCAGFRTTPMADRNAQQVPVNA